MKEAQPTIGANGKSGATTKTLCIAVVPKNRATSFPLYWLQLDSQSDLSEEQISSSLTEVLCDPLQEELWVCDPYKRQEWIKKWHALGFRYWAEKQFLFGVTDNLAHTVEEALHLLGLPDNIKVASGRGYLFASPGMSTRSEASDAAEQKTFEDAKDLDHYALYRWYHPIVENWTTHDLADTNPSQLFAYPAKQLPPPAQVTTISLEVPDATLAVLSKDRLLALTLAEMKAIRLYFRKPSTKRSRQQIGLGENPTDVELEVIAQTWSEHCKHKIFNATITHTDPNRPGRTKQVINSLYKTYIQGPTKELMETRKDLLSVFKDNSGVVRWDDKHAICFKVETHNSPSALEPYGGALTGILGVNRDVLGTGLGAKPIFNTDVFCFAYPKQSLPQRPKLLPAKTILDGVRKGVEDGGNKSGVPTVNGAIFFDDDYRAKPLVFCGTGGIMPLTVHGQIAYEKHTKSGDTIVMAGGRVGKDGVHGATFSSESLHEGSPMSAVQIGDPFTQKRLTDFIIDARDAGLITGLTDNGAGGLSSSVGEMAQQTNGATIELDHVPTKYPGLADWEIIVSESQERMTLATRDFAKLQEIAAKHSVEVTDIGVFDSQGCFTIKRAGKTICALELSFLHDGCPTLELESEWQASQITMTTGGMPADLNATLLNLLSHPNICSREAVIRQYDHEVKGQSVIKPLMGAKQSAPCDAAVIAPVCGDNAGLVVSNGLNPRLSVHDPHLMAMCAVDEAVRNAVCVGADPSTLSLLDNFCWPDPVVSSDNPHGKTKLAQLVRTCIGLKDAVMAFRAPLISGKDSMKNDFDDGVLRLSIQPTLLISAIGRVHDINECISMDFKQAGDLIYLVRAGVIGLAASHYEELCGWQSPLVPSIDLEKAAIIYATLHKAVRAGLVQSAHDLSEGGLAVAVAECCIGGDLGASLNGELLVQSMQTTAGKFLPAYMQKLLNRLDTIIFAEGPSHIVVTIKAEDRERWMSLWSGESEGSCNQIGEVTTTARLHIGFPDTDEKGRPTDPTKKAIDLDIAALERAWKTELPFD